MIDWKIPQSLWDELHKQIAAIPEPLTKKITGTISYGREYFENKRGPHERQHTESEAATREEFSHQGAGEKEHD